MSPLSHLWAIGYDDTDRARQVLNNVKGLAAPEHHFLLLLDIAVAVRKADGSYTLEREMPDSGKKKFGHSPLSLLAYLTLSAPVFTNEALDVILRPVSLGVAKDLGIEDAFIRDVEAAMKPGTSVIFVLDDEGDLDVILPTIHGLGGTVLRTNVDAARARLIQSTLNCSPP